MVFDKYLLEAIQKTLLTLSNSGNNLSNNPIIGDHNHLYEEILYSNKKISKTFLTAWGSAYNEMSGKINRIQIATILSRL